MVERPRLISALEGAEIVVGPNNAGSARGGVEPFMDAVEDVVAGGGVVELAVEFVAVECGSDGAVAVVNKSGIDGAPAGADCRTESSDKAARTTPDLGPTCV